MLDYVFTYLSQGIILIASLTLYVFLIGMLLPGILLRLQFIKGPIKDRGIEKYTSPDGRAIVYEPEVRFRKYIKQYMLCSMDGNKYIKCLIDPKINQLKYDVLVFDNQDKLIDVIGVAEQTNQGEYTRAVQLPERTSYVSVILRRADGMFSNNEINVIYPILNVSVYAACIVVATAVEATLANKLISGVFEEFAGQFMGGISVIGSLLLGIAAAALIMLSCFINVIRKINR
ncbi:MAG: hypothetical protein E7667_01685 [Ruminococcaceae bacterium]|nr:hypothetical protein [Oscillospiraceae bacterium]